MKTKHNYELKPLFIKRMKQLLKDEKDFNKYLDILKIPPVKSIRCNILKISPEELKRKLENKGWKIKQPWQNYPEIMIVEGKLPAHFSSQINMVPRQTFVKALHKNSINEKNLSKSKYLPPQTTLTNDIPQKSIKKNSFINYFDKSEHISASNLINLEPGELGRALEHLLGHYYIQELASMLPVIALKPKENETILDLCSSPGSKTTQISATMKNTGTIIANEISLGRIKILASNLERCGVTNTIITKKEGVAFCKKLLKENFQVDKILVDAPCSGEGTLRSSPKTYLMWNIKTVKKLSRLQKNLVASALEILKLNGELIYSTCTHAPEENEEVVDFILKEFKGKIKLEKIKLPIKTREGLTEWASDFVVGSKIKNQIPVRGRELDKTYSQEIKKCARIYPQDNNTEGFFIAKFRKMK